MFQSSNSLVDVAAIARELGVRGGATVLTRWHHVQPVWRALWPAIAPLGIEPRHVVVLGEAAAAALDLLPDDVRAAARTDVRVDTATAHVGRAAYPDLAWSSRAGEFPPGYLDLAIAEIEADARLSARPASFIRRLRADEERLLDLVGGLRAGGVALALVHGGLFERAGGAARERLHALADVVAMAKLPAAWAAPRPAPGAVDLVVLRRRAPDEPIPDHAPHLALTELELPAPDGELVKTRVNGAYLRDPAAEPTGVLGRLHLVATPSGSALAVVPRHGVTPAALERPIAEAVADYAARRAVMRTAERRQAPRQEEVRIARPQAAAPDLFTAAGTVRLPRDVDDRPIALLPGRLLAHGNVVYEIASVSDEGIETAPLRNLPARAADALYRIVELRDALYDVLHAQALRPDDGARVHQARARLNGLYDEFLRRHGPLNAAQNRRLYATEPDAGRLASLELYNDETGEAEKAEVFYANVIEAGPPATAVATLADALATSLDQLGRLDPADIARRMGMDVAEVELQLPEHALGYLNPESREWQVAAQYLSGDVRTKLDVAQAWAARDPRFASNVAALDAVQPAPIPAEAIRVRIGAPWIPEDVVAGFLDELYGGESVAQVAYQPFSGVWTVELETAYSTDRRNTTEFGTDRRPFPMLIESALNQRAVDVHDTVDGRAKLNVYETLLAHERLARLEHRFAEYLWSDPARRERLAEVYNATYNRFRAPAYDGAHLTFPGMNRQLALRPHQRNAVWRFLLEGNLLLAHEVATGKTFTQVACAMEAKRLGRVTKAAWPVPDHLTEQADRQARRLYPTARILQVGSADLEPSRRARTLGKIAGEDWDLVIYSYTAFGAIRHTSAETALFDLRREERETQEALRVSPSRMRGFLHQRLKEVQKRRQALFIGDIELHDEWGSLGHDMILVDEAHNFKNLGLSTSLKTGLSASERARDLFDKVLAMYRAKGLERGLLFATGTPLSNSLLELFNLQRYLQPGLLEAVGLRSFRLWARLFLRPITRYEPELTGEGFRARTRYVLENAPEVVGMLRSVMDVVDAADVGVARPAMETVNVVAEMSPAQKACMAALKDRLLAIRAGAVPPDQDNLLKVVSDGRKLGLDARLLDPEAPDWAATKVGQLADTINTLYEKHAAERGVQLVFCDMGVPRARGGAGFSVYADLRDKLVARGIPAAEIAFVHDFPTAQAKAAFFRSVRAGVIRVAIGSTPKMGEGAELQTRTVAVHHLDAPWRPSDVEQRDGRARREGNLIGVVKRFIYTTKDTFDRYMWDLMRFKAETFTRLLRGDQSVRSFDFEVDPTYAETVAITTGNPLIKARVELEDKVARLKQLGNAHAHEQARAKTLVTAIRGKRKQARAAITRIGRVPDGDGSALWRYDPGPDGLLPEAAFAGDTGELYARLPKYLKDITLPELRGLSYAGVPVRAARGWDPVAQGPRIDWYVRAEGEELHYTRAHQVAYAVDDKRALIDEHERELKTLEADLAARSAQAKQPFAKAAELELTARAHKVVEEMIRSDRNTLPDHVDIEVRRELRRYLMGPDGAALEPEATPEVRHESHPRPRESPAARRRHAL